MSVSSGGRYENREHFVFPITDHQFLHVGMRVATPDTEEAVVMEVRDSSTAHDRRVYVAWGDNNRRVYSFRESQQFRILGTRYFRVFKRNPNQDWRMETELHRGRDLPSTLDVYRFVKLATEARIAEVTSTDRFIRWLTDSEIRRGDVAA